MNDPIPCLLPQTDFTRYFGDSSALRVLLSNPDTLAAFDPTGCILIFTAKVRASDADVAAVIQKISTVGGIVVVMPAAGLIELGLVPADGAALTRGFTYVWDVQAQIIATGAIYTVARGRLRAEFDVTRLTTISIPTHTTNPEDVINNGIKNRTDLLGLGISAPGATKLSGISADVLAAWLDGTIVRLSLPGDITVDYRLVTGTPAGGESQWAVVCDNDPTRYWKLSVNPSKQGAPTVWTSSLAKFKQILEAGGALALADDADAFVITD